MVDIDDSRSRAARHEGPSDGSWPARCCCGAGPGRARTAQEPPRAEEGAQGRVPQSPRPASTRSRSATCTRARSRRTSSRRCTATTTWRGRPRSSRCTRRRHARGVGRLPHLDHTHPARHLLRRRPGLQGQEARDGGAGLSSTPSSASPTRPTRAQLWSWVETFGLVGLTELRKEALEAKKPFDYDRTDRRRACARPPHDPVQARASRGRASVVPSPARPARRAGPRGGRVLRRQDRRASGRHRAVPPQAVATQLADRAREKPRLPRRALRRRARRRRRRGPGAAGRASRAAGCR